MNLERVDQIAKAVLYEGYMLYPYRPSSVKNQQRWNFGVLYPQAYSEAQGGTDACSMQTECLVCGNADTKLEVRLRFLQLQLRLTQRSAEANSGCDVWQEAVEGNVSVPIFSVETALSRPIRHGFEFPAQSVVEPEPAGEGPKSRVVRSQLAVRGELEITAQLVGENTFKIMAVVRNTSALDDPEASRENALLQSLVSTHTILGVEGGEFVSLLEPPAELQEQTAACQNVGAWPVLVGEPGITTRCWLRRSFCMTIRRLLPKARATCLMGRRSTRFSRYAS